MLWFVGLNRNDRVLHQSVFSKNRDRLLNDKLADGFPGEPSTKAEQNLRARSPKSALGYFNKLPGQRTGGLSLVESTV